MPDFVHLLQKPPMPGIALNGSTIKLDCNPSEHILESRVKGVQQGRESGELDYIGLLGAALV